MSFTVRRVTEGELVPLRRAMELCFGLDITSDDPALSRRRFELDRTTCAFEGDRLVGTTSGYTLRVTVPGGTLPMAGTTYVSVLPTHRRRGALRQMMRAHLDDARARGEPLAGLWATESSIYGRFGYGLAAYQNELEIDLAHAAMKDGPAEAGSIRFLSPGEDVWATLSSAYDRAQVRVPGMLARSQAWWNDHVLVDPPHRRQGMTPNQFVLYEEAGEVLGYLMYRRRSEWNGGFPADKLFVTELIAATEAARAALWRYALGVDLVATLYAWNQPMDETLPWLLVEPRRLRRSPRDSLWLRPLDVEAALSGRRYSSPGRLVIGVRDDFCPWVEGAYALDGGLDGAECKRTTRSPDVELSAATLGALYLGGHRFQTLARAGLVGGSAEALRHADAMFQWDPLPFCADRF